ncbi:MAG: hypothetical protein QOJ97_177 [Solirubrobacteraceae bacterium]|jgi:hypothetical protein|nr:hypothetical protein [Solirubrobacteraceae bacterium]
MTQQGFQQALAKLVNDESFRSQVQSDPNALTSEFSLDPDELKVLAGVRQAATGAALDDDNGGNGPPDPACCCCCI